MLTVQRSPEAACLREWDGFGPGQHLRRVVPDRGHDVLDRSGRHDSGTHKVLVRARTRLAVRVGAQGRKPHHSLARRSALVALPRLPPGQAQAPKEDHDGDEGHDRDQNGDFRLCEQDHRDSYGDCDRSVHCDERDDDRRDRDRYCNCYPHRNGDGSRPELDCHGRLRGDL